VVLCDFVCFCLIYVILCDFMWFYVVLFDFMWIYAMRFNVNLCELLCVVVCGVCDSFHLCDCDCV